jgi:hypothetical protein
MGSAAVFEPKAIDECGATPIEKKSDSRAASDAWHAELSTHVDAPSRVLCIGHTCPGPTPGQHACESDAGRGAVVQRIDGAAAKPASCMAIQALTMSRSAFLTVLIE